MKSAENNLTGGSAAYYIVQVDTPTTLEAAYKAECNDLIEALQLTWAEANIFKAIWRRASARQGNGKLGFEDGRYDAEKILFFAERIRKLSEVEKNKCTQ